MQNRITIGMTAYNASEFISESIQSLLAQSVRDFSLIISDDASSDDTEKICKDWMEKDSRIIFVRQKINLGARANFEFVFNKCNTEYFMWASHDDVWSSNFIEASLKELDCKPKAGFVITHWIVESRKIPLIKRFFLPSMEFVSDPNPVNRMLKYTALPFTSFKDNLTYGVWRQTTLAKVIENTRITKYFSIGGVANEYALIISEGCYIRKAYLKKRYKYLPPGSIFENIFYFLLKFIGSRAKKTLYPRYTNEDLIVDLIKILKVASLDGKIIDKAVQLNQAHLSQMKT